MLFLSTFNMGYISWATMCLCVLIVIYAYTVTPRKMRKRRRGEGNRLRTSREPRQLVTSLMMMMTEDFRDNKAPSLRAARAEEEDRVRGLLHREPPPRDKNRIPLAEDLLVQVKAGLHNNREKENLLQRRWIQMIQIHQRMKDHPKLEEESLQQEEELGEVELLLGEAGAGQDRRDSRPQVRAGAGADHPREQGRQDR